MSTMRKLKAFYRRIPEITKNCPKGCTECCKIVPWSLPEARIVYELTGKSPAINEKGKCIFADENGCTIYEHRPFICRLYGHGSEENMCCDLQMSSDGMSPDEFLKLIDEYNAWVSKNGNMVIPFGGEDYIRKEAAKHSHIKLKGF